MATFRNTLLVPSCIDHPFVHGVFSFHERLGLPTMPASRPSASKYRNRLVYQDADDGMMFEVRCGLCRRIVNYWAADLVKVAGRHHESHVPPFLCSKCGTREYLNISTKKPSACELQNGLTVRRPIRKIEKWLWRNESTS